MKEAVWKALCQQLPYTYQGYSVHFSPPNPQDNGARHPEWTSTGSVNPLIFLHTVDRFSREYLGDFFHSRRDPFDWLAVSEHRLLGYTSGRFYCDMLGMEEKRRLIAFYTRRNTPLTANGLESLSRRFQAGQRRKSCAERWGICCPRRPRPMLYRREVHNRMGMTEAVPIRVQPYFSRDIKVIFCGAFADALRRQLHWTGLFDDNRRQKAIQNLYRS